MPEQGKRLDGQPFEEFDFGDGDDYIIRYHPRVDAERQVPQDFDQAWYDDRKQRGAFGQVPEEESFLRKWLYFEQDEADDAEWGPIRLIGRGGYGIVGLWQKRNDQNQIVDELILKQSKYNEATTNVEATEADPAAYPRQLTEAVIHRDINSQYPGVSPQLREYKFICDDRRGQTGRYRFYLEYCPYGSLYRLSRLYRCWDTYLPEVFIWHLFHSLAKACEALRDAPPYDSRAIKEEYLEIVHLEDLFCLHLDWKPDNVLLGYPHGGEEYPSVLLNDYGLSLYSAYHDSEELRVWNPTETWWRGTRSHKPTDTTQEQAHFGSNWEIPPDGGWVRTHDAIRRPHDWYGAAQERETDNFGSGGDVIFDHALNIYGAGQTIFDLVTLRGSPKHLSQIRAKTLERYRRNGNHQISHVHTKTPGVYSSRLRHLIRRCLDPDPANRPSQLELMDQTRRGLRLAIKRAKRHGNYPPKVYYRGHEINDMPLGDAGFQPSRKEFRGLIEHAFTDPDEPMLKLPAAKYGGFPAGWSTANWKTLYSQRNPHDRWFNGLDNAAVAARAPQTPPPPSSNGSSHDSDDSSDDNDDNNNNGGGGGGGGGNLQGQGQGTKTAQQNPKKLQFAVQNGNLVIAP
ncbi:hypothetical protein AYO21_03832 [Fonsecaea monophora]|uniref:non-specific serine/threonine protein kinase n=1 Tax=Fonsecaea monophora TaxID=254056 RepID=A0A177FF38_9EURO|nr:hypothetical protein AYO21_03832 [Fonsecaea monophora]OAG41829.1 hypothetical protein AYO21_03832 [Fonsecaea monophora]